MGGLNSEDNIIFSQKKELASFEIQNCVLVSGMLLTSTILYLLL